MARPDEFEVTFTGIGGHAAAPHRTVDTIVMAAQFVTALQTVVSRNTDPTEKAVVTVGYFNGGLTYNVIPEKVEIKGTIRSFSKDTADMLSNRVKELATNIARAFGGSAEFRYNPGYPAVINNAETTQRFMEIANEALGSGQVHELERPIMAGEDFAFYQEEFPGTFFFLGSGTAKTDSQWDWHHPRYNVDEEALKTGTLLLSELAFRG
jgi:amidohydrolase